MFMAVGQLALACTGTRRLAPNATYYRSQIEP
ncbi:hypothetical protein Mal15_08180 [Stieleria maiorica]|uniref:Uncharacterized protein n=1 Tax=Stieleria maiorica TaxID=2795974 RepID=A0A5B9M6I0_9BACT|nr:hypothetical protein Mal15_08180 [Stieleria maiorica]